MPSRPTKTVTLLLGGARSGKSRYAQELAGAFRRVVYIATASRDDAEMRARIAKHRRARPAQWKTVEVSKNLDRALREECGDADLVLIDCLTIYVSHVMGRGKDGTRRTRANFQSLCEALREVEASVILVSNEVGSGVVPPYRSGRDYRDLLGELNQEIARFADRVILMVAGLPMIVKGRPGKARPVLKG